MVICNFCREDWTPASKVFVGLAPQAADWIFRVPELAVWIVAVISVNALSCLCHKYAVAIVFLEYFVILVAVPKSARAAIAAVCLEWAFDTFHITLSSGRVDNNLFECTLGGRLFGVDALFRFGRCIFFLANNVRKRASVDL